MHVEKLPKNIPTRKRKRQDVEPTTNITSTAPAKKVVKKSDEIDDIFSAITAKKPNKTTKENSIAPKPSKVASDDNMDSDSLSEEEKKKPLRKGRLYVARM